MTSSKPFSIRFSEKIEKAIRSIASKEDKTTSEVIREQIERSLSSEQTHASSLHALMNNRYETLNLLREIIYSDSDEASPVNGADLKQNISVQHISVLMILWHHAYLNRMTALFANLKYVQEFLQITSELLEESKKQSIDVNIKFLRTRMGYDAEGEDDIQAIEEIKNKFPDSNSTGYAEHLLRPMEIMAQTLDQFQEKTVRAIFTIERLKMLFPVAMTVEDAKYDDAFMRDIKSLLPRGSSFKIKGENIDAEDVVNSEMHFMMSPRPFSLVLTEQGAHYAYPFKSDSILSLLLNLDFILTESTKREFEINFKTLSIHKFSQKVCIHENGAYRLVLADEEFSSLLSNLDGILRGEHAHQWRWLLDRYKMFKGDI